MLNNWHSFSSSYQNVIEAAMVGALDGVQICAGIVGNLIAFLSIYNFLNSVLIWLGNCAHLPFNLTFEVSLFQPIYFYCCTKTES